MLTRRTAVAHVFIESVEIFVAARNAEIRCATRDLDVVDNHRFRPKVKSKAAVGFVFSGKASPDKMTGTSLKALKDSPFIEKRRVKGVATCQ